MEFCVKLLSLPSWERGLKFTPGSRIRKPAAVAPLVGAWIEMSIFDPIKLDRDHVAPLVGAWIEIVSKAEKTVLESLSLPSWERGLKLEEKLVKSIDVCRSPRGSVD